MLITSSILLILLGSAAAEIAGVPFIECLPNGIKASVNMTTPFIGRIYLRGHHDKDGCYHDFGNGSVISANPVFNFDDCYMRRKREANSEGIVMSAVMVVSHNPRLVTFRDRAYDIQCFYRIPELPKSTHIDLLMRESEDVPMPMTVEPALPQCAYRVEVGNSDVKPNNSIVSVGDAITHIWSCGDDAPNDIYCMQVHSCVAESEDNLSVSVVDAKGCVSDHELISPITHTSSLRAIATARAFKFPARSDIRFACEIRLSLRRQHPEGKCPTPQCSSSDKSARPKRSASIGRSVDVETQQVTVLEDRVYFTSPMPSTKCSWLNTPFIVTSGVFLFYFILTFCLWLSGDKRENREYNVRL